MKLCNAELLFSRESVPHSKLNGTVDESIDSN